MRYYITIEVEADNKDQAGTVAKLFADASRGRVIHVSELTEARRKFTRAVFDGNGIERDNEGQFVIYTGVYDDAYRYIVRPAQWDGEDEWLARFDNAREAEEMMREDYPDRDPATFYNRDYEYDESFIDVADMPQQPI